MVLILHNIRSVYNTASIFRTADAGGGVEKIYLIGSTPLPQDKMGKFRNDFLKVSLGAEKNILWKYIKNPAQTKKLITELKSKRYKILAAEQNKKSIPYYKINKRIKDKNKIALILGNEIKGLPPSLLKLVDYILEIPMRGKLLRNKEHPKKTKKSKESLNVSIAFAVIFFQILYN